MVEAPTLVRNRYRSLRQEAERMLAQDLKDERLVIVESWEWRASPSSHQSVWRDITQTIASLDHPALPSVLESFREGEREVVVLEEVQGVPLSRALEHDHADPCSWARQIAQALEYLHNRPRPFSVGEIDAECLVVDGSRIRFRSLNLGRNFRPEWKRPVLGDTMADCYPDFVAYGRLLQTLLTGDREGTLRPIANRVIPRCLSQEQHPTWGSFSEILAEFDGPLTAPLAQPRSSAPISAWMGTFKRMLGMLRS